MREDCDGPPSGGAARSMEYSAYERYGMRLSARAAIWVFLALIWAHQPFAPVQAKEYVDLELVLAVDVSMSMDVEEQKLQRDGYVAAFRDPELLKAIQGGLHGRIAVTYIEWAGSQTQSFVVPWQLVGTAEEANNFADALAGKRISRAFFTSISGAIGAAEWAFSDSPVRGLRRVIDISGDGPNNSGSRVDEARDRIIKTGVGINGLAIKLENRTGPYTYFDLPDLDRYYRDCVIGGPGAFVLTIRNTAEFASAIRKKLLLEIAGQTPLPAPRVWKAQSNPAQGKYDCLIGEKMWQKYREYRGMDFFE